MRTQCPTWIAPGMAALGATACCYRAGQLGPPSATWPSLGCHFWKLSPPSKTLKRAAAKS
eukprot:7693970-Alexandrium_andersonii.AAC.1